MIIAIAVGIAVLVVICYLLFKGKPNIFMFQFIEKIFGEEGGEKKIRSKK